MQIVLILAKAGKDGQEEKKNRPAPNSRSGHIRGLGRGRDVPAAAQLQEQRSQWSPGLRTVPRAVLSQNPGSASWKSSLENFSKRVKS